MLVRVKSKLQQSQIVIRYRFTRKFSSSMKTPDEKHKIPVAMKKMKHIVSQHIVPNKKVAHVQNSFCATIIWLNQTTRRSLASSVRH